MYNVHVYNVYNRLCVYPLWLDMYTDVAATNVFLLFCCSFFTFSGWQLTTCASQPRLKVWQLLSDGVCVSGWSHKMTNQIACLAGRFHVPLWATVKMNFSGNNGMLAEWWMECSAGLYVKTKVRIMTFLLRRKSVVLCWYHSAHWHSLRVTWFVSIHHILNVARLSPPHSFISLTLSSPHSQAARRGGRQRRRQRVGKTWDVCEMKEMSVCVEKTVRYVFGSRERRVGGKTLQTANTK